MAEAEANLFTRRGFSKWLATVGSSVAISGAAVAAAAAAPEAETVSKELLALGDELRTRHQAWIDAGEHLRDVVDQLNRWKQENPEPQPYDADGNKLPAGRWGVWNEGHKAALKRHGKMKALNTYQTASVILRDATEDVASFQAETMTDLYFKAELAFDCDNDSGHIATSVVEDMMDMTAANSGGLV